MEFPMRINKYLSKKGFATRRSADTLIERGNVLVNGKPATLGQKVVASDRVEIKDFNPKQYSYILFNKPRGIITHSPASHEVDIETYVKQHHSIQDLFPIGRLDKASEGLVLLTDDGRVTERLLNPDKNHIRTYEVTVDKPVPPHILKRLEKGVNIEGYTTKPAKTTRGTSDTQFIIELTEGKKHQIRRMCAALGYQVQSLKRTQILNLELKRLKPGQIYKLKGKEIKEFLQLLGLV